MGGQDRLYGVRVGITPGFDVRPGIGSHRANGDFFKVGNSNVASAVSTLTKRGAALSLKMGSGAPLAVNSSNKVAALNADRVDGLDSTRLVEARGDINGNTANFSGILEHSEGASFLNTGFHKVVAHATSGPPVDVLLSCPSQTGVGALGIINSASAFGDSQRD